MPTVTQHSRGTLGFQPGHVASTWLQSLGAVGPSLCLWHSALQNDLATEHRLEPHSATPFHGCRVTWEHICLASALLSNKCFCFVLFLFCECLCQASLSLHTLAGLWAGGFLRAPTPALLPRGGHSEWEQHSQWEQLLWPAGRSQESELGGR